MSAENWTTCPKCVSKSEKDAEKRKIKAAKAYGKVSAEEWKKLDDAAHLVTLQDPTLREDYEIGITGDEFDVSYRASCSVCGFTFKFTESQKVE